MDCQSRQHSVVLVNKSNSASEVVVGDLFSIHPKVAHAGTTLVLAGQQVEESSLASSRCSHNRHELTRVDSTRDSGQDLLSLEMVRNVLESKSRGFVVGKQFCCIVLVVLAELDGTVTSVAAYQEEDDQNHCNHEQGTASNDTRNQRGVDLFDWTFVSWDFGLVKTLSTAATECDCFVAKDVRNEIVHGWLRERRMRATR